MPCQLIQKKEKNLVGYIPSYWNSDSPVLIIARIATISHSKNDSQDHLENDSNISVLLENPSGIV
jgi:hypothetical protein